MSDNFLGMSPLLNCQFLEGRDYTTLISLENLAEDSSLNGFYTGGKRSANLKDMAKMLIGTFLFYEPQI